MTRFIRKLCGRFLQVQALQGTAVEDINYNDPSNQLSGNALQVSPHTYTLYSFDCEAVTDVKA